MAGTTKLEGKNAIRAEKMLAYIAKIFSEHSIPYCIDGGTLLGIIRENRLLPWDNDMDFYINTCHQSSLKTALRKLAWSGYKIRYRYAKKDMGPIKAGDLRLIKIKRRKWLFQDAIVIDIFVKHHNHGRAYWLVGDKEKTVLKSVDEKFYLAFDFTEFKNMQLPIPTQVEDYLTARYGDWRTPVKEWNFLKDDRAIEQ